jgi:hypothetical protein
MSTETKSAPKKDQVKTDTPTPRKWDGPSLYEECKEQGIYPSFSSGNFDGYIERETEKKVATALPSLSSTAYDGYLKAEKAATGKPEKAPKPAKEPKAPKAPKPPKAPKEDGTERNRIDVTKSIKIIATENPHREGSGVFKNFALYVDGLEVSKFLVLKNAKRSRLRRDVAAGHIKLV